MAKRMIPHRILPAPTGGMQLAQRPTGIVMALVVVALALIAMSLPSLALAISMGVRIALGDISVDIDALQADAFSRSGAMLALFSFALAAAVIMLWVRFKERRTIRSLGFTGSPAHTSALLLRGALAGLLMITVCVFVPVATGQATLVWRAPEIGVTGLCFVAAMLIGFLLQGSTEELVTRGFFTQAVARRWGLVTAVIAQAVLFAAMHGTNSGIGLMPLINLVLFAVFASMFTLADGSLWGVCAFHGIWNWAQGNLFGVAVSGNPVEDSLFGYTPGTGTSDLVTGGAFGVEGSLITTLTYAAGALIAWGAYRRRTRQPQAGMLAPAL